MINDKWERKKKTLGPPRTKNNEIYADMMIKFYVYLSQGNCCWRRHLHFTSSIYRFTSEIASCEMQMSPNILDITT